MKEQKKLKTKLSKWRWDKWQREVLAYEGNITMRCGRQVGKSEVVSAKACKFATEHEGVTVLIIAAAQRQSSLLFEKVRANIDKLVDEGQEWYKEPPTLTRIKLMNGSQIYSLPAGRTGYFIRGFTIDMLIADEAAFIPEIVWNAVVPMIAVSRKARGMGYIVLLSTPFGKGGYYYDSFTNKNFKSFHISSEDCIRMPVAFLAEERERMTKVEYAQEYLGEFVDEWRQFFPTELIKKQTTFIEWSKKLDWNANARYYLGVDFARYGGDENAFVICEMFDKKFKIIKCFTTSRISTTDTIGRIIAIDKEFGFNKIFVDDGGIGGPLLDALQDKLGRKVLGLNNASRRVEVQGEEKKRGILKEDLYLNTLMLLEIGKLELISDLSLLKSMKSITTEYTDSGKLRIFGKYSHLTEALVRACWCIKERGLQLYVY